MSLLLQLVGTRQLMPGYNNENMPLGISFGGLKYSEPTLIEVAYAFEHATKKRRPPPDDLMQLIGQRTEEHKAEVS